MNKSYRVTLTAQEREELQGLINKGKGAARTLTRARILLKADATPQQGPAWSDERIRDALDVGLVTVYRVRQSFVEEGLELTLHPKPRNRHYQRLLDGDQEAHLIALACGQPPPVALVGPSVCSPRNSLTWGTSIPSPTKPCGRRSKKPAEAALAKDVVYPTERERRVRLAYGGCLSGVQTAL